jgi:hypothetical protein
MMNNDTAQTEHDGMLFVITSLGGGSLLLTGTMMLLTQPDIPGVKVPEALILYQLVPGMICILIAARTWRAADST